MRSDKYKYSTTAHSTNMIDDSHFKVDLTIEGSDFKSTKKSMSSFILQNATVASFSTYASNSPLFPVDSMHFVVSSSSD